jgi:XTP/dITP diphosphohydrolase
MTLYVATTNPGKLRDFAVAANDHAILPLQGLAGFPTPVEDAETFEGNAVLKAVAYSKLAPGLTVLADDSGIEVDGLDGAPGVRSARYAEDEHYIGDPGWSADVRNLRCLLHRAAGVEDRTARYRCVLVAARDGIVIATATGDVEGMLLREPRGTGGFGYDPIFLIAELGKTMAEIDPATRLRLSHRGRALAALLKLPALQD